VYTKNYLIIILCIAVIGGVAAGIFFLDKQQEEMKNLPDATLQRESIDRDAQAEYIREICMKEGMNECYPRQLAFVVEKKDFQEALLVLDALQLVAPQTQSCHLIGHRMASAAVAQNPTSWKELVRSVPAERCGGGFIHGIMEGVSFEEAQFTSMSQFIVQACASKDGTVDRAEGLRESSCAHIGGHLALVESNMILNEALSICSGVLQRMQYDCYSGAFMETYTRENLAVHGLAELIPWDEEAAAKLQQHCRAASGAAAKACWGEVPQLYIRIAGYDPPYAYQLCSQRVPSEYLDFCYAKSSGLLIVDPAFDRAKTPLVCNPFFDDSERISKCIAAVISWLMLSSTELTPTAVSFCASIVDAFRETCYQEIGFHLNTSHITVAERKRLCANALKLFRFACEGIAD